MPTINVRGVPQNIYDELRELAMADGQSLNAEAREIFEEGIRQRILRRSRAEALRMAEASRKKVGRIDVDTLTLLQEGRVER